MGGGEKRQIELPLTKPSSSPSLSSLKKFIFIVSIVLFKLVSRTQVRPVHRLDGAAVAAWRSSSRICCDIRFIIASLISQTSSLSDIKSS